MDDRIEHLMQELIALKEKRKAQLDGNCGENPILSRDECTELIKRKENYQDQDQKGKNANLKGSMSFRYNILISNSFQKNFTQISCD